MRRTLAAALALLALGSFGGPGSAEAETLPSCAWCGAAEAPSGLRSEIRIAGPDEPGERLVLTGTVYKADGRTPAPGVVIYAYHTNTAGIYPQRGDEKGNARRHGYLRGWVKTDDRGHYRISTIRPGCYPRRTIPAHIHMTVLAPGGEEHEIDETRFADDPLLSGRSGPGIIRLARGKDGSWTGVRDIVLEH